jgi:hypothetical protein
MSDRTNANGFPVTVGSIGYVEFGEGNEDPVTAALNIIGRYQADHAEEATYRFPAENGSTTVVTFEYAREGRESEVLDWLHKRYPKIHTDYLMEKGVTMEQSDATKAAVALRSVTREVANIAAEAYGIASGINKLREWDTKGAEIVSDIIAHHIVEAYAHISRLTALAIEVTEGASVSPAEPPPPPEAA